MEPDKLLELVKKNNPKLNIIETEFKEFLIIKIDDSRTSWKQVHYGDFYYNAYAYIKDVNKVKNLLDILGFSYKKGGIVGVSTKNLPDKRSKEVAIEEMRSAMKKYNELILIPDFEKLSRDQYLLK